MPGEKCGWGRQGFPRAWAPSSPASLALAYIHWDLEPALTKEASLAAQSIFPEYPQATSKGHHLLGREDRLTQRLLLVLYYKHLELSHLRLLPAQSLFRTRRHLPLTQGAHPYTALSFQTKHLWEEARQVDNTQDQLNKTWLRKEGNHLL